MITSRVTDTSQYSSQINKQASTSSLSDRSLSAAPSTSSSEHHLNQATTDASDIKRTPSLTFHPIQPAFPFRRLTFTSERKYAARDTPLHHLHVVLQTIKQQILESRGKWKIDLIMAPDNPASYLNNTNKTESGSAMTASSATQTHVPIEDDDDEDDDSFVDDEEQTENEDITDEEETEDEEVGSTSDASSLSYDSEDDDVSGDELRDLFMDQEENMLEPFGIQVDPIVDNLSLANSQDLSHMVPDWMSPFVTQHRLRVGPPQMLNHAPGLIPNQIIPSITQPQTTDQLNVNAPLIRDEMLSALTGGDGNQPIVPKHFAGSSAPIMNMFPSNGLKGILSSLPSRQYSNLQSTPNSNNMHNGLLSHMPFSVQMSPWSQVQQTLSASIAPQSSQVQSMIQPSHQEHQLARQDASLSKTASSTQKISSNTRWTPEDDQLLLAAYELYGASWTRIQKEYFPSRSISSIRAKHRLLNETGTQGYWSVEEDDALRECVALHGTNWCKVAESMKQIVTADSFEGRTANQCMYRWNKVLHPFLKRGPWTEEEDAAIINAIVQHGVKWSEISKVVPGRTDRQIRNRFGKRNGRWAQAEEKWTPEENMALLAAYREYGTRWSALAERLKPRSEPDIRHQLPIVLLGESQPAFREDMNHLDMSFSDQIASSSTSIFGDGNGNNNIGSSSSSVSQILHQEQEDATSHQNKRIRRT